ncbi:Antitoxin [Candidatus Magnetomoraceae bacterium gMMP-15]
MNTVTAIDAQRNLFEIIRKTSDNHEAYQIHHNDGTVIILSEEDYESMIETLEVLSIP